MKYTLETKIQFATALGRFSHEGIQTMGELGYSQEELDTKSEMEIEQELQIMFEDWEAGYLDSGWSVVEDES